MGHVVQVGEPELNCWCHTCQLPIRLRVALSCGPHPAGWLEICPGCGAGHAQPHVSLQAPAPEPWWRRSLHALRSARQPSTGCAYGSCRRRGRARHQHQMPGDDGMWRYLFCTARHKRAWATGHRMRLT